MKRMIRFYRLLKPIIIYTSYLFTALTILYLVAQMMPAEILPFSAGFLWGIFLFSLGSICMQRLILGDGSFEGMSYGFRLLLYLGAAGIWGCVCLHFSETEHWGIGSSAGYLVLLAGICFCGGFELFNRYRAYMYNRLLDQYKKRKRI